MKTISILFVIAFVSMLIFGCLGPSMTKLSDIKANPDKFVGQKVNVQGAVEKSIKLGRLSAFSLNDGTGTMGVSSEMLPPEGKNVTVSGTVVKDTVLGYYILASDVKIAQ